MSSEPEEPSRDGAGGGDEQPDLGSVATPLAEDSLAPPMPKFDRIGDKADRSRVFEALFEVPAERQKLGRYVVLGTLGQGGMGVVLEAFDRTLDRRVALKVLRRTLAEQHTIRLVREAQALAKLSHPNVVQVYESGVADGQTFIAMELVRGKSLRTWLGQQPRPSWRECVQVFVQAGDGLAAAHAQGLVHRDFKPSNAVLDEDGRVRVLDFGLAREAEDAVEEASSSHSDLPVVSAHSTSVTQTGTMVGTPSYMPPEQIDGREAAPRSDQFSFCVSLYEAVYGERPFAGQTIVARMEAIIDGEIQPAPKGTKVPAALRQVLVRGLAAEPEQRWSSMNELLAELRRLIAPRSWRWVAVGAGLVVGLGLLGAGLAYQADMGQRCVGAAAQLAGIWDDARRGDVEAAILGTELSYAPSTWERVEQRLDAYADAWKDKHTEVCMATSVRQEQTAEEMGLRMGCLRKRRSELSAAVGELAQADAEVVENAVELAAGLPLLDRCDDLAWLVEQQQRVPPPEEPQVAQQVESLREQLAEIGAKQSTGKYALALEQVLPVVENAEALGYMPLVAEAMLRRGWLQEDNGHYAEAEEDLRRAYGLAVEHDHEAMELAAARALLFVVGAQLERYAEGRQWGDTARPLAVRYGDAKDMALNAGFLGDVASKEGKYAEAESLHRRALDLNEGVLDVDHPELAANLIGVATALLKQAKFDEAEALFRRALRIRETALGPNHPSMAESMTALAVVLLNRGANEEAEAFFRRALKVREETLNPDHPSVAGSLNNLGRLLDGQGRYEEAEVLLRRAVRIHKVAMGPEHPTLALSLTNLARALDGQERFEESEALFQQALEIREKVLGANHPKLAFSVRLVAIMLDRQGKFEEAETYYRRVLKIQEAALSADHPDLATVLEELADMLAIQGKFEEAEPYYRRSLRILEMNVDADDLALAGVLLGLARFEIHKGDFEAARTLAERATSIREAGERGVQGEPGKVALVRVADAHFVLARALWNDKTQRTHALELAEKARVVFAEAGPDSKADLGDVLQWQAEHGVK